MSEVANNKLMVSVYQNFGTKLEDRNLVEVLQEIKSKKYLSDINSIRYALHKGDEKTADKIKSGLTGFTMSGTFGTSRTKANLLSYSQIIGLDFDHIPVTELYTLVTLINECKYTFASFISPSGEGIKVFIKINSNATQHTIAYNQVATYYKNLSGYDFDPKCKDSTRLCFVSSDPELHLNENATVFEVQEEAKQLPIKQKVETVQFQSTDTLLDNCLKFTEQKEQYSKGNRNNFIHLFASNANRFGIDESNVLDYCITNFDLDEKEIKTTVNSAYKNQSSDFAKFADFAKMQTKEIVIKETTSTKPLVEEEDYLKSTPIILQSVYDNLPPILFESCKAFKEAREKDVFLTGALAILSGCLPNVSGLYSGSVVYPSLFSFILAPAASGKGALKFAKALADKYHSNLLEASQEARKIYEEKLAAYKMLKSKNKLEGNQEMPQEPKFKVVYIPANTSNAKIIQHLDWNEGKGIICETEADTLGQTFKNDWGSYSDMLRKSFHHEKISVSRKTDAEFVEVNEPQLSVALSGTPKQVFNIIASAEDGLFSRFIFYVFKTDAVWLDPSPKGNPVNLTEYFKTQSNQVFKMVEFFERDEMVLLLTDEQWDKFNPIFSAYLVQISTFVSDDAQSVVKRLGIILFRLCMIFTAIRKFDTKDHHKEVYCSDIDFETALTLIKTYLQHSIIMFENLPKQEEGGVFKSGQNKKLFFDALPQRFTRGEAIELAKNFNIAERTAGTFLKSCLGKYLQQPEYGVYEKFV
ncbi:DUF3987 domain-containing protein [Flavobacterium sp. GSP27]|uniref:DUF3987 domain-containing protein n=1 Tax=Flavobacterium sp. GSP27 TaxID=2497489 RepID=UPI000F829A0B|nr:DUF3987 domain-containing protein [Flavobacterium sp. GSP27]RTZ10945.1 DUF3987 domain-containing protein [Flavobacterium sp. GSP27]